MRASENDFDRYTHSVINSMTGWAHKLNVEADTLYIGGGTPSLIGGDNISKIVSAAKELFGADGEITVECNPSAVEDGFFEKLKTKICIGQGWRGKEGELGVGNCTRKFRHSLSGCPPTEQEIYEFLKKYLE